MEKKEYTIEIDGKSVSIEISKLAEQANGSVIVKMGDTVVLATAVMSRQDRLELDYMPLTVDYEEKYYAAGKIYGSRFVRRESRPSENAILTGRLIDRTLRPRFDQRIRREIQVVVTCLSIDEKNDPDVLGILSSSLSLLISDIGWDGPVAGVRVGWSEDKGFILNPDYQEREALALDIMVSGTRDKINMLEAQAKEVSEDIIKEALVLAQEKIVGLIDFQLKIQKEVGRGKTSIAFAEPDSKLVNLVKHFLSDKLEEAIFSNDKMFREDKTFSLENLLYQELLSNSYTDKDFKVAQMLMSEEIDGLVHKNILEKNKRPDSRALDEVRSLDISIDILPRAHGSALFIRGNTQALSVVTLGAPSDVLTIQGMEVVGTKRFIHHYNFPPFCSGETGRVGAPGRREIGHGALAERSLVNLVPEKEIFPYTIRVVTEILSSNGSTSMASVCAGTLSMMAAGVPIKEPAAGIAMGLMSDKSGQYKILTDIQGPEDHYGDMDCKVAGTKKGITALQMDVKIDGLTPNIIKEVLDQAKKARLHILEAMLKVIEKPREQLSEYAPRITVLQINPEKIGELIGPGGKVINQIINETGVAIDIEDSGLVTITSSDVVASQKAEEIIKGILYEYKVGDTVDGKVLQIREFGAILGFGKGKEGLLHISELAPYRVNKVEDVVKVGDAVKVKIKRIENGKMSLSLKDMQEGADSGPKERRSVPPREGKPFLRRGSR